MLTSGSAEPAWWRRFSPAISVIAFVISVLSLWITFLSYQHASRKDSAYLAIKSLKVTTNWNAAVESDRMMYTMKIKNTGGGMASDIVLSTGQQASGLPDLGPLERNARDGIHLRPVELAPGDENDFSFNLQPDQISVKRSAFFDGIYTLGVFGYRDQISDTYQFQRWCYFSDTISVSSDAKPPVPCNRRFGWMARLLNWLFSEDPLPLAALSKAQEYWWSTESNVVHRKRVTSLSLLRLLSPPCKLAQWEEFVV